MQSFVILMFVWSMNGSIRKKTSKETKVAKDHQWKDQLSTQEWFYLALSRLVSVLDQNLVEILKERWEEKEGNESHERNERSLADRVLFSNKITQSKTSLMLDWYSNDGHLSSLILINFPSFSLLLHHHQDFIAFHPLPAY